MPFEEVGTVDHIERGLQCCHRCLIELAWATRSRALVFLSFGFSFLLITAHPLYSLADRNTERIDNPRKVKASLSTIFV